MDLAAILRCGIVCVPSGVNLQLPASKRDLATDRDMGAPLTGLIIDDDKSIRFTLSICLRGLGCAVTAVPSGDAALAALARRSFDVAFLDLHLGQVNGLDVLSQLLAKSPGLTVIVITAYAAIDTAVEAIKRGAVEYLPKPYTPLQIRHVLDQVLERRALARRIADLEQQLRDAVPEVDMDPRSPKMRAVLDMLSRAAASEAPVLLRGENGTGKGVLARRLHLQSYRSEQPFVVVNCPTLSEELLASELFGHAKGAFTGAVRDQPGRVEAAEGGTLFLDEIGEISIGLQAKLLRFLQDKEFERVGETTTRLADVRIVAATNRDLEVDVTAGRFRDDLLYRLNVLELRLPALRERPEDIEPLARRFVSFAARGARRPVPELSPETVEALLAYSWPGNVRELRNVIERAVILWPTNRIEPEALPPRIAAQVASTVRIGGNYSLDAIEREHILRVVARTRTAEEAAKILEIEPSTLYRKRKQYNETPA